MEHDPPEELARDDGPTIAYRHTPAGPSGATAPGVVFLGGFMSDMTGTKAQHLETTCRAHGLQFTRFDYRGHGVSGGTFAESTLGDWITDTLAVLDRVTRGPQILVGSSMGGWIMLHAALARRERVAGLVGIAPAPDFVTRMEEAFSDKQKAELASQGFTHRDSAYSDDPYVISRALIEDGKQRLLLGAPIALDGPVRVLHGMQDDAVPWQLSLTLAERLTSRDVRVTFVKDGDHRLSTDADLALLATTVLELALPPQA